MGILVRLGNSNANTVVLAGCGNRIGTGRKTGLGGGSVAKSGIADSR